MDDDDGFLADAIAEALNVESESGEGDCILPGRDADAMQVDGAADEPRRGSFKHFTEWTNDSKCRLEAQVCERIGVCMLCGVPGAWVRGHHKTRGQAQPPARHRA
jgi:hypothetical protein